MSLDASALLYKLTLIELHNVSGSCLVTLEMLERGYGKMTRYLMGESFGVLDDAGSYDLYQVVQGKSTLKEMSVLLPGFKK